MLAEIAKCDIVCVNCHRWRTARLIVAHGGSWVDLLAEIEKCRVLCANCHRRATAERASRAR